jgi:hypothetical protein
MGKEKILKAVNKLTYFVISTLFLKEQPQTNDGTTEKYHEGNKHTTY